MSTQTQIKIESGIPFPTAAKSKPELNYPLNKMKVGDSFLVKFKGAMTASKARNGVSSDLRKHQKTRPNFKLKSRIAAGGVRFWRVK